MRDKEGMTTLVRYLVILAGLLIGSPHQATAQEKDFSLGSAEFLIESGFLQHLLPRFSLKTGIKIELLDREALAQVVFTTEAIGRPVMQGAGQVFSLVQPDTDGVRGQKAQAFVDWLASDIGKRTITQFSLDGQQVFTLVETAKAQEERIIFEGDIRLGAALSLKHCGRCHVIGEVNRMNGIGSTPSFALLRSLPDWAERFASFYTRRPHPAITRIDDVTEPFDPAHPPSVYPLYLRDDDLLAILAFVNGIEPADLGAELIIHQ